MVSVLPNNARSPFSVIGQDVSRAMQGVISQDMREGMQRQRGLGAIDQLQEDLKNANGDISKMLPALARAYTLNPPLERSGLGQEFMKNQAAGMYPNALGQGAGVGQGSVQGQPTQNVAPPVSQQAQTFQPSMPSTEGKQSDIDTRANEYLAQVRPDLINPSKQFGAINTFEGLNKQDLSPEEEAQARNDLMKEYKNPKIVDQVIDRLREGIKNKHNEALSKYKFDADKINQINEKWANFTQGSGKRLEPHIGKYGDDFPKTKEVLTNKYNQYAGKLPPDMTPEQMHENAMALVQNDINKIDALAAQPAIPPIRGNESVGKYIDTYKDDYQDLAKQGFTEALKEDAINNKDMGNEEFHSMIYGDQTNKNFLNKVDSIKAPKEYEGEAVRGTLRYNKNYPKQHEKYVSDLAKSLKSIGPKDDLVLTRAMVLNGGGEIQDFNNALRMAQEDGLKLSPLQESQKQEASIPRVAPLWEIFSEYDGGNPLTGILGNLGWKSFINYVRGKK